MSRGFGFARVYSLCFDSCQFFLVSYLVGRLAAKELHGAVDFLGDYVEPIPHEREVCDWNLGACKCVQVRGNARKCAREVLESALTGCCF